MKRAFTMLLLVVFLVWGALLYYLTTTFPISSLQESGQLGDTFGVFNSLASALAFVSLSISLFLQHRGLDRQAESLRIQQEALGAQQKALERQASELTSQRDEFLKTAKSRALGMHINLLALGMQDDVLGKVWTQDADDNITEIKQVMYVSLIAEQWRLLVSHDLMSREKLRENLENNMKNAVFQRYWSSVLATHDPNETATAAEKMFYEIGTAAYRKVTQPRTPPTI
jgi:hypothetical protein